MASHYDKSKNCRVGTMDLDQFYDESGSDSAAYFETLLAAWSKAGGTEKWGAGGVGLRCSLGSKDIGVCFLAPAFGTKKDRIELSLKGLAKQMGAPACTRLKQSLSDAAGDSFKGATMVSVVEPGALKAKARRAITTALVSIVRGV